MQNKQHSEFLQGSVRIVFEGEVSRTVKELLHSCCSVFQKIDSSSYYFERMESIEFPNYVLKNGGFICQ